MRAAFLPLALLACVDPTPYAEPPALTSEVDDWRDEIVYQLLVDRFGNGDVNNDYNVSHRPDVLSRHLGGDWQGVIDHVDYLEAIGVTTVWVSPIVVNVEEDAGVAGYHGYWTQDFKDTNPHFGDIAKFREMVEVLHAHGIKVILDIVTNHVGQLFYYDINQNGQPDTTFYGSGDQDTLEEFGEDPIEIVTEWDPAYDPRGIQGWTSLGESGPAPLGWVYMPDLNRIPPEPAVFQDDDWYNRRGRVTDWNQFDQVVYGDFPGGLKDLDTANPEVVAALIDVFQFWIEQTNIDGYRIDTVKHVEHGFWRQFAPAIREFATERGKERFFLYGEAFDGDDALIGSYTFDQELDSVFYFSQKFQVYDDVFKHGGPTSKVEDLLEARAINFGDTPHTNGVGLAPQEVLVNFIDNHDIPRFLYDGDEEALRAALVYLFTQDGIPCLYYGTEQGFSGGNDPANREPLWESGYDTTAPLFQHVAGLTRLRRDSDALRRGTFQIRWASDRVGTEEDAHVLAFERASDDDRVLVVINTGGDGPAHTSFQGNDMPVGFAPGADLQVVYPLGIDRTFTVSGSGTVRVDVDPYEALVLAER